MVEKKLTFSITYYSTFQNIKSIMEELHVLFELLIKTVRVYLLLFQLYFSGIANSLRIAWLEPHYPNLMSVEKVNHLGKTCLVYDSLSATTTVTIEACQDSFKIQKRLLNCDSENNALLIKMQSLRWSPARWENQKKFRYRFKNYKSKHRTFRKSNWKVR